MNDHTRNLNNERLAARYAKEKAEKQLTNPTEVAPETKQQPLPVVPEKPAQQINTLVNEAKIDAVE